MKISFQSFRSQLAIFCLIFFGFSFSEAKADFKNLIPCKESAAFEKRLNTEIKKLENRLKFYTPESREANALISQIESTKTRFNNYGKSNLLCGKEGFPRIIATGQWDHVNEFVIPGVLFIYITGWIGWVGRKYIQFAAKSENSFENEIILNVPKAYGIATTGFLWPIEAWNELKNGELVAAEEDVTVSPR